VSLPERIVAVRRIHAPADRIFTLVSDPLGHVRIDGSGMLIGSSESGPLPGVGSTFEIDMDREPLGDIPLGKYRVRNTVTKFEQNRCFEWSVALVGMDEPIGHVYGYLLDPVDDEVTEVSNYCDWSNLGAPWKGKLDFPIVPLNMLQHSLEKLGRLVE
jgi:hypothetical protein